MNYQNIDFLHQIHRSNVRLGLLIFSNLVVGQRGGIIKASTTNYNNNGFQTDSSYLYKKGKNNEQQKRNKKVIIAPIESDINIGTSYTFDIPINFSEYKQSKPKETYPEEQGTPTSVLQETLNYKLIDSKTLVNKKEIASTNKTQVNGKQKKYIVDFRNHNFNIKNKGKYEIIEEIASVLEELKGNVIALLDAEKIQTYKNDIGELLDNRELKNNPSGWIRLLASIQFENKIPLIILNLDYSTQEKIIEINQIYAESINNQGNNSGFWKKDVGVIFYNKETYDYNHRVQKQTVELWFNNVLLGNTYDSYVKLNKQIATYQYNQVSINDFDSPSSKEISEVNENIFFSGKTLINFELLIKEKVKISGEEKLDLSLFESSVRSLLNLDIDTLGSRANKTPFQRDYFFNKFKGYKISDSHFKLGSKIHINDFYYAKRLFYNSFYANRFAFLIAQHLLKIDDINKLETNNEKLTLIGYGKYSELLVSNVRRILQKAGGVDVNHDVFLDDEKVFKNINNLHKNVIIIIPISSTFSTSNKIKRWLEKSYQKQGKESPTYIANQDINVLLVADKEYLKFDDYQYLEEKKVFRQYQEFSWNQFKKNDNTTILLKNSNKQESNNKKTNNNKPNDQKYFIPLLTNWQSIHNCKYCFPKGGKEKCLLDTITNNVTPDMIFGLPLMPKPLDRKFNYKNYISDNNSLIIKRHIVREHKPHQYYIRTGAFLKVNKDDTTINKGDTIKKWLGTLKEKFSTVGKIDVQHNPNIIITPSHTANSGFVNLVNEVVFEETATILQYSDSDDLLENFIQFNSSFFIHANIFFVDDIIHSGNTFHSINSYLKQINHTSPIKVHYAICMIKRTNYFHEKAILNALDKDICYYSAFHLPSLETKHYPFPLIIKEKHFEDLSENAVTDTLRFHFKKLGNEVKAFDLNQMGAEPTPQMADLFNTLVIHSLYQLFEGEMQNQNVIYSNTIEVVLKNEDKNVEISQFVYIGELLTRYDAETVLQTLHNYVESNNNISKFIKKEGALFKNEIRNRIIYLFCTPPLSYYKTIKEIAFKWVLKKLKDYVKEISNNNVWLENMLKHAVYEEIGKVKHGTQYNSYQTFRLYLRLGAELNCNYIFSREMLLTIGTVIDFLSSENTNTQTVHYKRIPTEKQFQLFEEDKLTEEDWIEGTVRVRGRAFGWV